MADLSWVGQNAADGLAGALKSVASLAEHRPEWADALRAAVLEQLGDLERELIRQLAEETHA